MLEFVASFSKNKTLNGAGSGVAGTLVPTASYLTALFRHLAANSTATTTRPAEVRQGEQGEAGEQE